MSGKKTVLITGGAKGIGAAAARLFADEGWSVGIAYHTSCDAAQALVRELVDKGCDAAAFCADVSDSAQIPPLFVWFIERFSRLDALVNNAGIARQQMLCDTTLAQWRELFGVLVEGTFLCCKEALKTMVAQKSGSIVNLSSIWGMTGASCEVCYSSAKAAVIGLTKALAKEAGPAGIRVNCVAPGVIDTEMNRHLCDSDRAALCEETPLGVIGSPFDAAASIVFLASQNARFITGQVLSPNGGLVI